MKILHDFSFSIRRLQIRIRRIAVTVSRIYIGMERRLLLVKSMTWVHIEGKNKGKVLLFALSTCVWCKKTRELLTSLGVKFSYIYVDQLPEKEMTTVYNTMKQWNPAGSFPTLVVNENKTIVGFRENEIREVLG